MKDVILVLHETDNVGVALEPVDPGTECRVVDNPAVQVTVRDHIPFCHKIALRDIKAGENILKYGEVLGTAEKDVPAGTWVHCHNLGELLLP